MPARPIVLYPDQRLRQAAEPVTQFDAALRTLAADLFDTMQAAPGIGITAPHIGVALRVVVLDLRDTSGARTYVNPEIIWASDETIRHEEGSVSMPGVTEQIERPAKVRVRYQDLDGEEQIEDLRWPARNLPPARNRSVERPILDTAPLRPATHPADSPLRKDQARLNSGSGKT